MKVSRIFRLIVSLFIVAGLATSAVALPDIKLPTVKLPDWQSMKLPANWRAEFKKIIPSLDCLLGRENCSPHEIRKARLKVGGFIAAVGAAALGVGLITYFAKRGKQQRGQRQQLQSGSGEETIIPVNRQSQQQGEPQPQTFEGILQGYKTRLAFYANDHDAFMREKLKILNEIKTSSISNDTKNDLIGEVQRYPNRNENDAILAKEDGKLYYHWSQTPMLPALQPLARPGGQLPTLSEIKEQLQAAYDKKEGTYLEKFDAFQAEQQKFVNDPRYMQIIKLKPVREN